MAGAVKADRIKMVSALTSTAVGVMERGQGESEKSSSWGLASCKLWLDLLAPFAIITAIQSRRRQVNRVEPFG